MSETKYFICPCQHCHELIQFPAESVGLTTTCPHCAQETELILPPPPEVDDGSRRTKAWAIAGAIILLLGLVGAMVSISILKKYAAESRQKNPARANVAATATNPPAASARSAGLSTNDFIITLPRMEKASGSSLTYAVGTVRNGTDRTRYGVKIELALLNADGETVGKATDYHQVLEARAEWKFRALVLDRKATGVRLEQIREDQ